MKPHPVESDASTQLHEEVKPAKPGPSAARGRLAWLRPGPRIWTGPALAGILLLGGTIRLWGINSLGYNSDEAVYAGQAAAIAEDPQLKEIFPIFRAHPLLFQYILAVVFRLWGVSDLHGRIVAVVVGLVTLLVVYLLGKTLYGRRVGVLAALLVAVMPYHVIVTRQVLLDGPMVLFASAALLTLAKFAETRNPRWLHATGAMIGLTFLAKETGVVLIGAVYAFLALSPMIRVRIRDLGLSVIYMILVILPFPISVALGGGTDTAKAFLVWQLFRRPNHEWPFYFLNVPPAIGLLVLTAAVGGLWLLRRSKTWRETLLVAWILVPVVFFQIWPVKGFQYLLPTAVPLAILAARFVFHSPVPARVAGLFRRAWRPVLGGVLIFSLLIPAWGSINRVVTDRFLAGSGGVPGGREAGHWVGENVPEGSVLLAIGPSMANIIQFYGHRRTLGLSVSPNPLNRNPAYTPVINPDLEIRSGRIQYLVFDAYTAARTEFFANSLMRYARRYNGRVVHVETVDVTTEDGRVVPKPVIVIYEVRP